MLRRRKNVFLTLWLSYVLILLIPVSISILLYTNIENTMVDNANRSNLAMLEQAQQIVDSQMQDIDRMIVQIYTHPKLQTLWNLDNGEQYLEYSEAVTALKNIRVGSGLVENFYIRLDKTGIILTPNMKTDTATFFTQIAPYRDMSVDQVKQTFLSGYHFKTFWPSVAIMDSAVPKNVITCAVSLPLGEYDNVRATLLIQIGEQQIINLLKKIEWAGSGSIYILDDSGKVIMSTSERNPLPIDLLSQMNDPNQFQNFHNDGKDFMLSYTRGESGWKYVSVVPKEIILMRVNGLKLWALTLLAVVLLAGTGFALWMAYRSYSPIRDMVLTLMNGKSGKLLHRNEYEFIQSSIKEKIAEGEQLRQKLEDHIPVLRAHVLTRLLRGQAKPGNLSNNSFGYMDLRLPYDYLCILLLEVDDSTGFIRGDNEEEWALVRFVIINLSSEFIGDKGYVVETDVNRLAIVLSVPDPSEITKKERADMIDQLKQVIETRFRMKITIATSSIHKGLAEIRRGYQEALSALDYRIIHGINSSIYYDDLVHMESAFYHYPMETELQLMDYLKSGKYSSAVELLDELYEYNVISRGMTPEMGKCLFFDLLSTALKVIGALKIDERLAFEGTDPVKLIANSPSVEEMLRKMKDLCRFICDNVLEARNRQSKQLIGQIRTYIQEHFHDHGLSLTALADHFQLAPQYVSTFFKKQAGINLTDYIIEIRIQEAKRYLADPSLTVQQIADKIGYATDIGFIRVFKKHEGITPGKYRELILHASQVSSR